MSFLLFFSEFQLKLFEFGFNITILVFNTKKREVYGDSQSEDQN